MNLVPINCSQCQHDYLMRLDEVGIVIYFCPLCDKKDQTQKRSTVHPGGLQTAIKKAMDLRQPQ
jgi:hypothetical protein